jgi:hypothetical protein
MFAGICFISLKRLALLGNEKKIRKHILIVILNKHLPSFSPFPV